MVLSKKKKKRPQPLEPAQLLSRAQQPEPAQQLAQDQPSSTPTGPSPSSFLLSCSLSPDAVFITDSIES